MEIQEIKRPRIDEIEYQCDLLNRLNRKQISITFKENDYYPSIESIKSIMGFLHDSIQNQLFCVKHKLTLIELQLLLFSSIVGGECPVNFYKRCKRKDLFHEFYGNTSYLQYLRKEIEFLCDNRTPLFSVIDEEYIFESLSLFMILNGNEAVISSEKLKIIFGRYHYILNGNDVEVRDELVARFKVSSHFELLKKLRLISDYEEL